MEPLTPTEPPPSSRIDVVRGDAPLVVTFPHTGTEIPDRLLSTMHSRELALLDTDWWIHELYDFVSEFGATTIRTPFSRSVIDVNRDPSGVSLYPGQVTTSLVPVETFNGAPLYARDTPTAEQITLRRANYFDPFHSAISNELARVKSIHGYAILYDCHSIRSVLPRLFPGELPIFNIGTNGGSSCDRQLADSIALACLDSGLSVVVNGRFKGGWITRNHGRPSEGIHAIQMELAQRFYMEEDVPARHPPDAWRKAQDALRHVMHAALQAPSPALI